MMQHQLTLGSLFDGIDGIGGIAEVWKEQQNAN